MEEQERKEVPTDETCQVKCEACGGVMRYAPDKQNLKCIYCGHEQELDKTPIEVAAYSFEEWCESEQAVLEKEGSDATQSLHDVKCKQCGAITAVPEHISSMKCPFCGSSLVLSDQHTHRFWKPGALLPFKIEEKQGRASYKTWLSGKWYAPNKLKKNVADATAFRGIYLPYWAYDADTHTSYYGKRGDNRSRTVERDGKREVVTEVEWTRVSGNVDLTFNNVLVPATDTLPPSLRHTLTNWDLDNSVAYRKEFVSGFVTELYKKDFVQSVDEARSMMENSIDQEIRYQIGGDHQRILSKDTDCENLMFKLFLLPVWISSFRYQNKVYQFVVNGRTGEVQGEYPKSVWKIIFTVVAIIALLFLLYYWLQ